MLLLAQTDDDSYSLKRVTNPNPRIDAHRRLAFLIAYPSTSTQRPFAALCSTASHTRCVRRPFSKSGCAGVPKFQPSDKVGDRVQERVFVSDARAGHPVMAHVRVLGVRDMDFSPTGKMRLYLLF